MARNPVMTSTLGGGGCPSSMETLIPDLPFDFLQPMMRKQVTQVGYGGPFVIRGNPIGAILDTIRGFCSPVPMQMSSDGGVYSDLSGNGLGSYGDYTSTQLPLEGQGYGGFAPGGYQTPLQCSAGYQSGFDAIGNPACVPVSTATATPAMTPVPAMMNSCDDPNYLNTIGDQAAKAFASKDCMTLCQLLGTSKDCANNASLPGLTGKKGKWWGLWGIINGYLAAMGIVNCDTQCNPPMMTKVTPPSTTMQMMTGGGGGTTSPSGGGTSNPSGTNPLSYITMANPGGSNPTPTPMGSTGAGPGMAMVTNPPSGSPPNTTQGYRMPAMPEMPSPFTLTEGNLGMMPSMEPMGGVFDPGNFYSTQRVITSGNAAARQRLSNFGRGMGFGGRR